MAHFSFKLSTNTILGHYSLEKIGIETIKYGEKVLFVADPELNKTGITKKITDTLENHGVSVLLFDGVGKTARSDVIERALILARGAFVDAVIGMGSIWTTSIGRTVAALYHEKQSVYHYIEGASCTETSLPFLQINTTAVDPFAFTALAPIVDARDKKVHILKLQQDICKVSLFDPISYSDESPHILTGIVLQGISTAFEGYMSTKSNFFSDTMLEKALELFFLYLNSKKEQQSGTPKDILLMQSSYLADVGLAFSSPGLSMAIALSCAARYDLSVETVNTLLFPYVLQHLLAANVDKIRTVSRNIGIESDETNTDALIASLITMIKKQTKEAQLPKNLKALNMTVKQLLMSAEDAVSLDFINYIPRPMGSGDIFELLKEAL